MNINLIPAPKKITVKDGAFGFATVHPEGLSDERLIKAANKLPVSKDGAKLSFKIGDGDKESYELLVSENEIKVSADGVRGAFYAIQTLRQLFDMDEIPCIEIFDEPEFESRGFYHDITRGRVQTVKTLKKLIDDMAYYKMNALQLYVEHTYMFKELLGFAREDNVITSDELKELDLYAKENFIDFIPSIPTFGHIYELLSRENLKHLQCATEEKDTHYWARRMWHHTIDPKNEESFNVIKSLIDQYIENFTSKYFNICCDETFDLANGKYKGEDTGKLYVEFVKKIISYVESKGKTVMMWGDILLNHPEVIDEIPDSVVFLNWDYAAEPSKDKIKTFSEKGKCQYVCPGTDSWEGFIEKAVQGESNITKMAEYGKKYGAKGVLNTNWGDWGNPCSLDMAMHGFLVGAEKSWNLSGEELDKRIDTLLYKKQGASELIKDIEKHANLAHWNKFVDCKYHLLNGKDASEYIPDKEELKNTQNELSKIIESLKEDKWGNEKIKSSLILATEAVLILCEAFLKISGESQDYSLDINAWLNRYRKDWLSECKESELKNIEEVIKWAMAL